MTDDTIAKLPVRFRKRKVERAVAVPYEVGEPVPCQHMSVTYIVNGSEAEVTCGTCKAKLNPMWVLGQLAHEDRRMADNRTHYAEEMKRLQERSSTKCSHCGKMTRISRSSPSKKN